MGSEDPACNSGSAKSKQKACHGHWIQVLKDIKSAIAITVDMHIDVMLRDSMGIYIAMMTMTAAVSSVGVATMCSVTCMPAMPRTRIADVMMSQDI